MPFTFDVTVVSDNEVDFVATGPYHTVTGIATQDGTSATYTFNCDGVQVLQQQESLDVATTFGAQQQLPWTPDPSASPIASPSNGESVTGGGGGGGLPSSDYWFDGVAYRSSYTQPYNHPDKSYYRTSPYHTQKIKGYTYEHKQIDVYTSNKILGVPTWATAAGIGAAVGALVDGVPGAVVGSIIGAALGAYLSADASRIADENGNIWVVLDYDAPLKNYGTSWAPCYGYLFHRIQVGPYVRTNFYYFPNGC